MNRLNNFATHLLSIFKRFPMVTFSAYLMTIILLTLSIVGHGEMRSLPNYNVANKVAFLMTLAMPLFFMLRLLSAKRIMTILGIGLLALYYFFVMPPTLEGEESSFFQRHFLSIVALFIFSFVAPYLSHPIKNEDYWEWVEQILFALLSTLIFSAILFLGLEGAKYALKELFNLETHRSFEQQFLLTIFGLFSINYFLSQIPKEPLSIRSRPYSKIENIFTRYILTPLVVSYFLILFVYSAKIIWLGVWPTGVIAWLVLIFSALAILTLLFWTPLWNQKNQKYRKIIWIAILLQTIVLAISIYLRIDQYGVTENRYFIAMSGFWLFVTSLYFMVIKNASYRWIFISIPLLILISQIGPLNAHSISKESQVKQLQKLLSSQESFSEQSDNKLKYAVSSKIDYLYTKHGIDTLIPIIPEIVVEYKLQSSDPKDCKAIPYVNFPDFATQKLGFNYINKWEWEAIERKDREKMPIYINSNFPYSGKRSMHIAGYEWLESFSFYQRDDGVVQCLPPEVNRIDQIEEKPLFSFKTAEGNISIEKEGKIVATFNIEKFLTKTKALWKERSNGKQSPHPYRREALLKQEELTLLHENEMIKVKLLFHSIDFSPKEEKLQGYSGEILIHQK